MVEAVLEQLEVFASRGPVALAVDDLHWADPLTLRAVRSVARQLSGDAGWWCSARYARALTG